MSQEEFTFGLSVVTAADHSLFTAGPTLHRPRACRGLIEVQNRAGDVACAGCHRNHDSRHLVVRFGLHRLTSSARAANRLGELERGVVAKKGADRWIVPGDLVEKLESRWRTELPRQRLWLEKVPLSIDKTPEHRGPVWLDKVDEASLASWGFGTEVSRALSKRHDALRAFGISPDDHRREAKLREMERLAIGEKIAARTGQHFLSKTPDRFLGKVLAGPEGVPYAVVTDRLRFILVPASRETLSFSGKAVTVSRDEHGRLSLRVVDRDLGR